MTADEERAAIVAITCPNCDGEGGTPNGGQRCCGNAEWECGARGCTGPIDEFWLDQCELCGGSGQIAATLECADEARAHRQVVE